MTDLATKIEQAQPGQEREVLEALWVQIHHGGYPPEREDDDCPTCACFRKMLDAQAWLSAVEMLVPEHCGANIYIPPPEMDPAIECGAEVVSLAGQRASNAATPALALAAAIARSQPA